MRRLLVLLVLFAAQLTYAQDQPAQQEPPTQVEEPQQEVDPIAEKIKILQACVSETSQVGSWQVFLVGDSDEDKLNLIKALDLIAAHPFAVAGGFETSINGDMTVRSTKLYFKVEQLEAYRKLAISNNNQALLDRVNNDFSMVTLFKGLLAIDNLQIMCNRPSLERSMAPSSGVTGSN